MLTTIHYSRNPFVCHGASISVSLGQKKIEKYLGTKFMSSGAAYGNGIYMANQLSVSLHYASGGSSGGHWPQAETEGEAVIVAVCEVVNT